MLLHKKKIEEKKKREKREKEKEKYNSSLEAMEAVNIKYHDLKRLLNEHSNHMSEETFKSILNSIADYGSVIKCGNDTLDLVFTEAARKCQQNNINFQCIADGSLFNDFDNLDTYSLFNNALNNAIESSIKLKNDQYREIQVNIYKDKNLALVRIQNIYDGKVIVKDKKLVTTKKDKANHGYGIKSMEIVVKKYQGVMNYKTENNIFVLQLVFPFDK